jgi:2-keto-4-pentenoate hydratase
MKTRRADAEFDVDDLKNDAIATELLDVLDRTTLIAPITARVPGFGVENAYEVSAQIAFRRRARGERPIGRKLGFTNRTIWPQYGVDSPIWAPVYGRTVTFLDTTPGSVAIGHLAQPRIEPEIVLHFQSPPSATTDEAELLAHVDWIAHGFEIVQCHFPDWTFRTADAIADFGLHGALVVGPRRPVSALADPVAALRSFTITLARNGVVQARGGGANVLGSPLLAVADLLSARKKQTQFEPIWPGEIVTTGTLTRPVAVHTGETWSTEFSGIGLDGLHVQFQ